MLIPDGEKDLEGEFKLLLKFPSKMKGFAKKTVKSGRFSIDNAVLTMSSINL
jgi:hypothetical protein